MSALQTQACYVIRCVRRGRWHCSRKLVCTQCTRCVGWTRRQGRRSGRRQADGVVEPSIVKKQRPEPGYMTKEEVYRTKKQRGKGLGTKTRGYVGPWTQARTDGSAWSRPRERKSEESRARRASSTSEGSFSTENYVKFVLFNIADGFPCFHG